MFSIIIPLYNKQETIKKTVDSILQQSLNDFELIIVNDGSTDKSVEIVESIKDSRIRLINQKNQGVSAARNTGIKNAKYDWIAFLDGDDLWDKDFLKTLNELSVKYPNAGLYCGQYVQFDEKRDKIYLDRFPNIDEGFFKLYDFLFAVWSSSILVKKEVFETVGYFDTQLTHGEDLDMWIRIAMVYETCYTNKIVALYNIGGNPLTRSVGKTPPYEKRLLSKIDVYLQDKDNKFYNVLLERKVINTKRLYVDNPFNPIARNLIKSLPVEELNKKENWILRNPMGVTYIIHVAKSIKARTTYLINRIKLSYNK